MGLVSILHRSTLDLDVPAQKCVVLSNRIWLASLLFLCCPYSRLLHAFICLWQKTFMLRFWRWQGWMWMKPHLYLSCTRKWTWQPHNSCVVLHWTSRYSSPSALALAPWNMRPGDTLAPTPATPKDMRPEHPLLVTSCGHHRRPVQTCSLDLTVHAPWGWRLVLLMELQSVQVLECFLVE